MKKQETPFTIRIGYENTIGKKHFSLERSGKLNQHSINGVKITKKKYHETLPYKTVYISPFDMNLLYFAPSMRREWVDEILERTFSQFHLVKREYETVMRQRNALLKKIRDGYGNRKDLDYWDRIFSEKASIYSLYREKWCQWIQDH
jgi:DNA replication and repair protein RecF